MFGLEQVSRIGGQASQQKKKKAMNDKVFHEDLLADFHN